MGLVGGRRRYIDNQRVMDEDDLQKRVEAWLRMQRPPFNAVTLGVRHNAVCRADGVEIAEMVTSEAADSIVLALNLLAKALQIPFERQELRSDDGWADPRTGFRLESGRPGAKRARRSRAKGGAA